MYVILLSVDIVYIFETRKACYAKFHISYILNIILHCQTFHASRTNSLLYHCPLVHSAVSRAQCTGMATIVGCSTIEIYNLDNNDTYLEQ